MDYINFSWEMKTEKGWDHLEFVIRASYKNDSGYPEGSMGWMIQTMERHWRVLSKEIMRSDSETLFQL